MRSHIGIVAGALLALATTASAQSFTVGAGGSIVNDTGTAATVGSFRTGGGFVFGEVILEPDVVFQLRASRFVVPGTVDAAPNIRVDAGDITVGYHFREEWFTAGIYAGLGVYRLVPRDPNADQTATDPKETVFGWTGSLMAGFTLTPSWQLRLEGSGHLIRSGIKHDPIILSAAVAYRF